jgi:hypothetical protein
MTMSKLEMLSPENHAIALVDYQPAMYQGVQSHDRLVTFNNVQVLAKAAKLFGVPTIVTTVAQDTFSGPFMPEVTSLFPGHTVIDRTSMNAWLDAKFREAVYLPAVANGATSSMCIMPAFTVGGIGTSRQWSRPEASALKRPALGRWERWAASHSPMRTGAPVWGFRSTRRRVTKIPTPVRSGPSIRFSQTAITSPWLD